MKNYIDFLKSDENRDDTYILPLLLGYSSIGHFSFVFEKDIISSLNSTILNIALYLNYGL